MSKDIPLSKEKLYSEEKRPVDEEPIEVEDEHPPLPKHKVILLNVTYFGLNLMFLVLTVEVVPAQIQSMVGPGAKGRWLGGMVAAGSVLTFLCGPLVGMKSDRLVTRFGKRRPIMVIAALMLCVGLFGMAFSAPKITIDKPLHENSSDSCVINLEEKRCQPYANRTAPAMVHQEKSSANIPHGDVGVLESPNQYPRQFELYGNIGLFITFYLVVTTSFVSVSVPYNALIADLSHPKQRGLNSGVMGFMILAGNIAGASLGLFFLQLGVFGMYGLVVSLVLLTVLVTVCSTQESPTKGLHEPAGYLKTVFMGFWEPLKEHDFRWVFLTRFFMQQGVSTTIAFLEYWLSDMIALPLCWSPERSVALMLLPLLGTAAFSSVVCGVLSDKMGRRKPLVIMSAMMMCVVTVILAFMRGEHAFWVSISLAFLFGAGFGAFVAVDFALVMDVLPEEKEKAKDLAVWHQAMVLPQALATPIGGLVLDLFESVNCAIGLGYIMLFMITAVYFFMSGAFVLKIRRVR